MAILTGAQVVSDELGLKLDSVDMSVLGTAKKVIVSKDETTIVSGGGSKDDVKLEGDEATGAAIVFRAVEAPIKQIAENAGLSGDVVMANKPEPPAAAPAAGADMGY